MTAWKLALIFVLLAAIGCNQDQASKVTQVPEQRQVTPTETNQRQGTQGTVINNNFWFGTAPAGDLPASVQLPEGFKLPFNTSSGGSTTNTGWGMAGNNITLTMTTGGTTPSVTGTASGTATASQVPSQTSNASPVQDVKPEFTSAVPISVGLPGSAVSGTANAAGSGGQLSNPSTSTSQSPLYQMIKVPQEYASKAIAVLEQAISAWQKGKSVDVSEATSQPE